MTCLYTIWPADREGLPAETSVTWLRERHWLVLDVTDGLGAAHIVEGPVSREMALHRALELREHRAAKRLLLERTHELGPPDTVELCCDRCQREPKGTNDEQH